MYHGKNLKESSPPEPLGQFALNLGCSILGSLFCIAYINDNHGLTLAYFMARSNLVPQVLNGKKLKKCIFCFYCVL